MKKIMFLTILTITTFTSSKAQLTIRNSMNLNFGVNNNEIRFGNLSGPNTGLIKYSNNSLGIFTWADAQNIKIGGNLVKFQKENNLPNDVYASGKFGIGIIPNIYVFDVVGSTRLSGTTYQSGNLGIFNSNPLCALDINQGSITPNVVKVYGTSPNALVNITSTFGATTTSKTGIYINRTENDPNTIGGEIYGNRYGIITNASANLESGPATGISSRGISYSFGGNLSSEAIGVQGVGVSGKGIAKGLIGNGYGNDATQAYGVYASASTGSSSGLAYGIYADYSCPPSSIGYAAFFNGSIYSTGMYLPSDKKLKSNVSKMESTIEKIMKLKPSTYEYLKNNMNLPEGKRYGFIADELGDIFPTLIKESTQPEKFDENGMKIYEKIEFNAVNYVELIPILTKAIQEQQDVINSQQNQLDELKNLIVSDHDASNFNSNQNLYEVDFKTGIILSQNIPNPFTTDTRISYSIPQQYKVAKLGIYDLNGQELKLENLTSASGEIVIQGRSLKPGMYIYCLIVDGQNVASKKMTLTSN